MSMKGIVGAVVLFFAVVFGITWFIQGNDFFLYKVFAPKYEQVRRETFEQSKAYNQGMAQELEKMYREYNASDATQSSKDAIVSIIRHRYADFDSNRLVPYLRDFLNQIQRPDASNPTTKNWR